MPPEDSAPASHQDDSSAQTSYTLPLQQDPVAGPSAPSLQPDHGLPTARRTTLDPVMLALADALPPNIQPHRQEFLKGERYYADLRDVKSLGRIRLCVLQHMCATRGLSTAGTRNTLALNLIALVSASSSACIARLTVNSIAHDVSGYESLRRSPNFTGKYSECLYILVIESLFRIRRTWTR